MWFQQDGATWHTTRANMALLQETFPGRIRSSNLTPLDFFWYGYAKDRGCANKPSTLQHLNIKIRRAMAEIPTNILYVFYLRSLLKPRNG